jgi:hypothetical protein
MKRYLVPERTSSHNDRAQTVRVVVLPETKVPWYIATFPPSIAFCVIGLAAILRADRKDIPTFVSALMRSRPRDSQHDQASLPAGEEKSGHAGDSANGRGGGR